MCVNQNIVTENISKIGSNVSNTAHIGSKVINLIDADRRLQAVVPSTQIENLKFIGCCRFVLWIFQIGSTNPIPFQLQPTNQVMPDESTGTGIENARSCHRS